MVQSVIYRTNPAAYIKEIIVRWFVRNIWWFVGLIAACFVLAFTVDTAFLFVSAIVTFIVFPFVVANVYFNYGLRPSSRRWGAPRRIEFDSRGITVKYVDDENIKYKPEDEFIPASTLRALKIGEAGDVVYLGKDYDHFLIVPVEAFAAETNGREQFHEYIYQTIHQNCVNLQHEI